MSNRLILDEMLCRAYKTQIHENVPIPTQLKITPYRNNGGLTRQEYAGKIGENACLSIGCIYCKGTLYNMNDIVTNCEAIDLKCRDCQVEIQVKSFADNNQIHVNTNVELELRQGGSYRIVSDYVRENLLIYAFVHYDPVSLKIKQIIYSSILESCDVLGPYGQGKKCRIRFRNPIALLFD